MSGEDSVCVEINTGAGFTGVATSCRQTWMVLGATKVTTYCLRSSMACCRYRRRTMKHWLKAEVARALCSVGCTDITVTAIATREIATTSMVSSNENPRAPGPCRPLVGG